MIEVVERHLMDVYEFTAVEGLHSNEKLDEYLSTHLHYNDVRR